MESLQLSVRGLIRNLVQVMTQKLTGKNVDELAVLDMLRGIWFSAVCITCNSIITTSFLTLMHNDLRLSFILFTIVNMVHYM